MRGIHERLQNGPCDQTRCAKLCQTLVLAVPDAENGKPYAAQRR